MPVVTRTVRKFRSLARARIELGVDALDRLVAYDNKHPDKDLFDPADLIIIANLKSTLVAALAMRVPVG